MGLTEVKPNTRGKELVLARARYLTDLTWTPLRDFPMHTGKVDQNMVKPAGVEMIGAPYSSNEATDKFIGENVSLETLITALENPDSVVYQKTLYGYSNASCFYGLACNGLARFALGIKQRYSTKRWDTVPGMRWVAEAGEYTVDQMELCDVLHTHCRARSHVAMITGLRVDKNGKVTQVEVSEGVRRGCKRVYYTPEEYYEKFALFALCRYEYVDEVIENDPRIEAMVKRGPSKDLPRIAVDYGNKSNYFLGDETVISCFYEGESTIEIYRNDALYESIKLLSKGKLVRRFDRGYYRVRLVETGDEVEFCVNYPIISHTVENGIVTITVDSGDPQSRISHMDFREANINPSSRQPFTAETIVCQNSEAGFYTGFYASLAKMELITEEEARTGVIVRKIPEDAGFFKVSFENRYGIWTHQMIRL